MTGRWRLAMVVSLAICAACALVPDDSVDPVRGAASAVALDVHERGVQLALGAIERAPPGCREPLPEHGAISVESVVEVVRKAPGVSPQRIVERRVWRRDDEGDISALRVIRSVRPDGRPAERTSEVLVVGGRVYAAIDGRFAAAERVAGLGRSVDRLAFGAVDAVLSRLRIDGHRLVASDGSEGICPGGASAGLPAPSSSRLELGRRGRSGHITWSDLARQMSVTLRFDEVRSAFAVDVSEPDRVWPVDPDPSWREVSGFISEGVESGWMQAPARPAVEGQGT